MGRRHGLECLAWCSGEDLRTWCCMALLFSLECSVLLCMVFYLCFNDSLVWGDGDALLCFGLK